MKNYLFVILISVLLNPVSFGQTYNDIGKTRQLASKNIAVNPIRHSFDVLNYKLNLNFYDCFKSPYNKSFSAVEKITFRVDSTLNFIKLNAVNYSLIIDSVLLVDNFRLNYNHNSNILLIGLNKLYNPGEIVSVKIYYRHKDVIDTSFFANNGLVYTDCEPEGARYWFPCWDKPSDKATTDITVKTPSNVLLGSNGRLADSVSIADTVYYHWISDYPMSTYLVAVAGSSNYRLSLQYWRKLSNPNDSIPIRIYYNSWRDPSRVRDSIKLLTDFYSQFFSEYPFEKIGFAEIDSNTFGGCMENQTLITVYPNAWTLPMAVHEFGHHWFGDIITCATWADLWLNESFGTYCESLMEEHLRGSQAYNSYMDQIAANYFSYNNNKAIYNPLFINYTPPKAQMWWELFFYPIKYSKGACVLHMLRNVTGDSTFFKLLKSYINDTNFIYKNVTTDDFTEKINQVTGQDYTWFIDEWVKQPNHPKYTNNYFAENIGPDNWKFNFTTSQNLTYSTFHKMPVELKVKFNNGSDTLIKVMNDFNNQSYLFYFDKRPDSVKFDPYNKIILKEVKDNYITGYSVQCSNSLPKPISDNLVTKDTIRISQEGTIKDIKITVNIEHSNDGDLTLVLTKPQNGSVTLSQANGEGGQNYTNTTFDDSASVSITKGIPPFSGIFKPQWSFSGLYEKQMSGDWVLMVVDGKAGNQGSLLNWCIKIGYYATVGLKEIKNEIINEYNLFQNYPNPFNPITNIKYQIPKNSFVTLKVYDVLGREVETLVNEFQKAGTYETQFPSNTNLNISSGIYFYRLSARDFSEIKKMVLIK